MGTLVPFKAYAPLFIHADAVLPFPVAGKCFKAITWQGFQGVECFSSFQYPQPFIGLPGKTRESRHSFTIEQARCLLAFEAFYYLLP
jgi:hypothetical protein